MSLLGSFLPLRNWFLNSHIILNSFSVFVFCVWCLRLCCCGCCCCRRRGVARALKQCAPAPGSCSVAEPASAPEDSRWTGEAPKQPRFDCACPSQTHLITLGPGLTPGTAIPVLSQDLGKSWCWCPGPKGYNRPNCVLFTISYTLRFWDSHWCGQPCVFSLPKVEMWERAGKASRRGCWFLPCPFLFRVMGGGQDDKRGQLSVFQTRGHGWCHPHLVLFLRGRAFGKLRTPEINGKAQRQNVWLLQKLYDDKFLIK